MRRVQRLVALRQHHDNSKVKKTERLLAAIDKALRLSELADVQQLFLQHEQTAGEHIDVLNRDRCSQQQMTAVSGASNTAVVCPCMLLLL